MVPSSIDILDRLIAFPTISRQPNAGLIDYVRSQLADFGIAAQLVTDPAHGNTNLVAVVGPGARAGVMVSGHTDVVPVAGQAWMNDPFRMTRRGDRLYGRGTADMKGFIACAIRAACLATQRDLAQPLRLVLSCDEEIGCVGVRSVLDVLAAQAARPALCIVGEPTSLCIATGHKGKIAFEAVFTGSGGHSASAPLLVSAIHMAHDFVTRLRDRQALIAASGTHDPVFDIPYSTLHVGQIAGGEALNIVPARCTLAFEARLLPGENAEILLAAIQADAQAIAEDARQRFAGAGATITISNRYPGLDTRTDSQAVAFVTTLLGSNQSTKLDFGTEAGLFDTVLGTPTVVCGPGSMEQGHKADEYIEIGQMERCDRMLGALIDRLASGQIEAGQLDPGQFQ